MAHPAPADIDNQFNGADNVVGEGFAATCRPAVRKLDLTAFRNHVATRIELDLAPVVLSGANGAGKTNILEALSFLAPGRGMRRCRLSEIDSSAVDNGAWAVSVSLATEDRDLRIGTGRDPEKVSSPDGRSERRVIRIDGVPARNQQALADILAVIWLTPEHDRLFAEGASGRRRFLDRLVAAYDPEHSGRVANYDHTLRERGRLLVGQNRDQTWLNALEQRLAEAGIAICHARHHLIARLASALTDGNDAFLAPTLTVSGTLEDWLQDAPALVAEDRLRAAFSRGRDEDAVTGGARVGPHRSDLAARHPQSGQDARACSTGEQKAMVIAIVLAHARLIAADRGAPPLLLLDEVAAHLDAGRRAALFHELVALNAQAWMTGADRALFSAVGDRANFLSVQDGRVTGP